MRGVWLGPPSSQGPCMVPAKGGPKSVKLKSSWHPRRRSKTLAVSLKHWKGRRGGGLLGGGGAPPAVYGHSNTFLPSPDNLWLSGSTTDCHFSSTPTLTRPSSSGAPCPWPPTPRPSYNAFPSARAPVPATSLGKARVRTHHLLVPVQHPIDAHHVPRPGVLRSHGVRVAHAARPRELRLVTHAGVDGRVAVKVLRGRGIGAAYESRRPNRVPV